MRNKYVPRLELDLMAVIVLLPPTLHERYLVVRLRAVIHVAKYCDHLRSTGGREWRFSAVKTEA